MPPSCNSPSEMGISGESTVCQDFIPTQYDCLHMCLADLSLIDLASKARLLQSLSSYLSCVAATMSASTDDFSLSAWVGTLEVHLRSVEVIELHNLLVRELQDQTGFIARPHSINYSYEAEGDENDAILSRALCLEVVSETLRCCIRILPLVDCFDTSVSLSGAALLDGLMQQLCSPTILLDVLSRLSNASRWSKQQKCPSSTSWRSAQGCQTRSGLLHSKELLSVFSTRSDNVDDIDTNSQFERETQQRIDVFLAILEVYMDELLLCPDLGARFLTFQDESLLLFKQECLMSSFARHTEASLDAAFVHTLLSYLLKMDVLGTKTNVPSDKSLVCNLSPPASLILLETLAEENVPTIYMTHIIQLVARVLDSSTSWDRDQVAGMTSSIVPEDCSWWSGGVDWSYCLKRLSMKYNPMNLVLRPKFLSSMTTVNFASSIFEQAMLLYRRFSTSSHLRTGGESVGQSICQSADSFLKRMCVSKYRPLLDMFRNKSELDPGLLFAHTEGFVAQMLELDKGMSQAGSTDVVASCSDIYREVLKTCVCHYNQADQVEKCEKPSDFYMVKEKGDRDEAPLLVSAVLHLGISSLECITREIGKMMRVSDILQFPSGHPSTPAPFEDNSDSIFAFLSSYLNSFLPIDSQACGKCCDGHSEQKSGSHCVTDMVSCGQRSLISTIGKVIMFFTNVFCDKVQNGAPEELLEDYFHLLESLVALLLVVDGSKNSTHFQPSVSHNESKVPVDNSSMEKIQRDNSSFSWLGAMVLLLQNMLQELSTQQRPLPEFFLDFVLEQIPRGDGLDVVAMAFSGSFQLCLDGRDNHQSVMLNVGSFQSKGLVNQILQLALQKPNRPSSLSTLIGYITSVLEDLLPITATLSLHEVSESVFCYEHIASTFTLACKFAASEESMVIRNGHKCRSWLFSRMSEGIERLFTEGTAVAEWISNWTSSKIPSWSPYSKLTTSQSTCSLEAQTMSEASYSEEGQFQFCSRFLVQIDLLRRTVGDMRNATDRFLIPELEFSPLLLKARTFLEAFSRLRMMVDKPVRQWRFHVFLQEQLSLHAYDRADSAEEDLLDKERMDSETVGTEAICEVRSHIRNTSGPEKDESKGDHGQIQGENARSEVRDPIPSGSWSFYGEVASKDTAAEQIGDCTVNEDAVRVELPSVKTSLSVREYDLHNLLNKQDGEGPAVTGGTDKVETAKVPTVSKRITRSATMSMSQMSGGGADMPAAEVVVDSVESVEFKERPSYSSNTLAIVKRLTQIRQPPCKKAKRDTRGFTESRYAEGLDLVPLLSRESENTSRKRERPTDGVAHQGAVSTTILSNPYIESVSERDLCQESFDDLNDFITCKKGRNYSKWLKKRQNVRRRLHTRNLLKRLQEKRDLLLLLDICE